MKNILLTALFAAAASTQAADFLFMTTDTNKLSLSLGWKDAEQFPIAAKCEKTRNCLEIFAEYLQSNNAAMNTKVNGMINQKLFPDAAPLNAIPSEAYYKQHLLERIQQDNANRAVKDVPSSASNSYIKVSLSNRGHYKDLQLLEIRTEDYRADAAHSIVSIDERVFSADGQQVHLADIVADKDAFNQLAAQAVTQWQQAHPRFNAALAAGAAYDYDNFTFAPEGIVLVYGEYPLPPDATAIAEITIPYSTLRGVIKDDYLPE